jgi:hypothetical protein
MLSPRRLWLLLGDADKRGHPNLIQFAPSLPKPHSGKFLRKMAEDEYPR